MVAGDAGKEGGVSPQRDTGRRSAYLFILLLGVVSMFADATYESARSIFGQFLATLGATGASVGLIAGFGELLNNGLRVFSGWISDRTRRPWRITLLGFSVNMMAVPLLALATTPIGAAMLLFLERAGKAVRNPPRDAMLSNAARLVGDGRGFGVQEALGQIGAVVGPLAVGLLVAHGYGYRFCFALMTVPAVLTLAVLFAGWRLYPDPGSYEAESAAQEDARIPRVFWLFLLAAALMGAGYLDFPLIAYSLVSRGASEARIPGLYAMAMCTQAVSSLGFGFLFDRRPAAALLICSLTSIPIAILAFQRDFPSILAAMVLWGVGFGAQKTVFKATISRLVSPGRRGTAYGVFFGAYGLAWFLGSTAIGYLHDNSMRGLIVFSVCCQLFAVPLVIAVCRLLRQQRSI